MENSKIYTERQFEEIKVSTRKWLDGFHRKDWKATTRFPFILNKQTKAMILGYDPYADLSLFDNDGVWIPAYMSSRDKKDKEIAAFSIRYIPIKLNFQDVDFYLRYAIPEKVKAMDGCFGGSPRYDMNRTRTLTEFTEDDYDSVASRFEGTLEEARLLYDLYLSLVSTPAQTAEATKA